MVLEAGSRCGRGFYSGCGRYAGDGISVSGDSASLRRGRGVGGARAGFLGGEESVWAVEIKGLDF